MSEIHECLWEHPKVSVIIPTYNHAHYLKDALESVLRQSFKQLEVIVVDNFSDDNTFEIVRAFNDSRIKFVQFKNNGVIASSRNYGIQIAQGDWIAFLDSDDQWYPEKLSACLKYLQRPDIDMICHGMDILKKGQYWRTVSPKRQTNWDYFMLLEHGNPFMTSAVMVRKAQLEQAGYFTEDANLVTVEDFDLWLKLAEQGCRFISVPDVLGSYRWCIESMSRKYDIRLASELLLIEKHTSRLQDEKSRARIAETLRAMAYYTAARSAQSGKEYSQSISYCLSSIRRNRLWIKSYVLVVMLWMQKFLRI